MESNSEALNQENVTRGNVGVHTGPGEGRGTDETGELSPLRTRPSEGMGPGVSSRAYEDAMIADHSPERPPRVNSSELGEAGKRHTGSFGEKFSTLLSTARFEGQADSSKPQGTFDVDASKSEKAGERQGEEFLAGRLNNTEGDAFSSYEVPEGCIPYLTDMSLFKKFGWPSGRLVSAGPSGGKMLDEARSTAEEWVDGSWRPKIIGSNVKCLPVVHPDTCGLTASFTRVHESPWVWRLERDENAMPSQRTDDVDYADIVWIFRGTFVSKVSRESSCWWEAGESSSLHSHYTTHGGR